MKTIENWSLKATYPTDTNDPLEFIAKNEKKVNFIEKIRKPNAPLPYFHSFSSKVTDVAMWGRYADSARGVCMAFCFPTTEVVDFKGDDAKRCECYSVVKGDVFYKVKYADLRVRYPIGSTSKNERIEALTKMLTTKAVSWREESEYRFINNLDEADSVADGMVFYKSYMNHLCGVILGERCPYCVKYVEKLFSQFRKKKKIKKNVLFKNKVWVKNGATHPTEVEFEIRFVQSHVHHEKFEIINDMFCDDMHAEQFFMRLK